MADDQRRETIDRGPVQERQGVREPQPLDRGVETDRPERKVGDKMAGEGREDGDPSTDREPNDPERAPDEPAEGPRAPQEPRSTHAD